MKKLNKTSVSIIVPVYKAESYLPHCVDSILAQSFSDFELFLIDDGSPDGSGVLCDSFVERDARIRVIHKPNGGVSSARNAGLDQASGDYVVFIDSDDHVGPDYLKDLLDAADDGDMLVISDYQPFNDRGEEKQEFHCEFTAPLDSGSADDFRKMVFGFLMFPPYCKLYRRRIIEENRIRFDTRMRTAEDFDFNMRYIQHVAGIHYIPSVQYFYRIGYKAYIPSNGGVLGHSEIRSVHTMANGIVALATRMGCYEELEEEICLWAAKKHYFNRMPMLFARNPQIGFRTRKQLYQQLTADETYRRLHKKGIQYMKNTTTGKIGSWADSYTIWWLFYRMLHLKSN